MHKYLLALYIQIIHEFTSSVYLENRVLSTGFETRHIANNLVKNPGEYVDYHNLYVCYCKYKMWDKAIKTAKEWHRKYDNPQVIISIAEAYYYKKNYEKALKYYNQFEAACALDDDSKRKKLFCLSHQSDFEEALALIQEIGLDREDEALFLQKATFEHMKGENLQAISTLAAFLELNPKNIKARSFLVRLLEAEKKGEAFQQIKTLYELHPDNVRIGMEAIRIGYNTGHDDVARLWMLDIMSKDSEQKYIKRFGIEDLRAPEQRGDSKDEEFYQMLLDGKTSIHSYFGMARGVNISKMYYGNLIEKDNGFFPISFGLRPDFAPEKTPDYKVIAIDYTAILIIYALDLFPKLRTCFENIIVSPALFPFIAQETADLNSYQESRVQKDQQLLRFIEANNIGVITTPSIPDNHSAVEGSDLVKYNSAIENGCILVVDSFFAEMFNEPLPAELNEIRVFGSDIWEFLCLRGETDRRNFERTAIPENRGKIDKNTKLLISKTILEDFQQHLDLKTLLKYFNIYVMDHDIKIIQESVERYEKQKRCLEWIRKLTVELRSLYKANFISFCPIDADKHVNDAGPWSMLAELLSYATTNNMPVWIDDRYLNSYPSSLILGVFDMLWYLLNKGAITQIEYYAKISELYSANISFHIPNYKYIAYCLFLAESDEEGTLIETEDLINLKRSFSRALISSSSIGQIPLDHIPVAEYWGYMINLTDVFRYTLVWVWSTEQIDVYLKIAMSNWLLINMFEYTCDVSFTSKKELVEAISRKHWYLIANVLLIESKDREDSELLRLLYCIWAFQYLDVYWEINPDDKFFVAHELAKFCASSENSSEELESLQKCLPTTFFNLVCMDKLLNGNWEHLYREEKPEAQIKKHEEIIDEVSDDEMQKLFLSLNHTNPVAGFLAQPEQWKLYFALVQTVEYGKPSLGSIIDFANKVLDQSKGKDIFPAKCKDFIAMQVWRSVPEERVAIQELRRRIQ